MTKFYTNVRCFGNYIYYRGIENGQSVKRKVEFKPTLFLNSKKKTQSKYRTLNGQILEPVEFDSIKEAKEFVKNYENVDGFSIYGNTKYEYVFISEQHKEEVIDWNISDINVAYVDIEVNSDNGFPEPEYAREPVTAITIKLSKVGRFVTFGCGDYVPHRDDVDYIKCDDEYNLLKKFLTYWTDNYPDVLTGWNVKGFDMYYLVNRTIRILGEDEARKFSPWNIIHQKSENFYNREIKFYDVVGIAILDYLQLFRKYAPNYSQETYRLDHIAQVEGVGAKLNYDEFDSLHDLYTRDFQKYIEYNIRDVELVEMINVKGKKANGLISMALSLAYDNKTNIDDVFSQVRMWDTITYNHLKQKNIVIPPKKTNDKDTQYEGAFVKDPQIGKFDWVVSFDLNSLYPHLIMQYNISPETLVEPKDYTPALRNLISSGVNVDKLLSQEVDTSVLASEQVTLTPNGQFFRTDILGFLPEIMQKMYDGRVIYKKKMIEAQKKYEETKDSKYVIEIAKYKNLQLAKKVGLNSAYGALGNEYFRFFDIRQAEGITMAGQLSIQWIMNGMNRYLNKILATDDVDYVIAMDTDSLYITLEKFVEKVYGDDVPEHKVVVDFLDKVCEGKLQDVIDGEYTALAEYINAYSQKMFMKRENIANRGFWTAKKRYALNVYDSEGVRYSEPQLKITGLETVKSSTPAPVRKMLTQAIEIILEKDNNALIEFIEKTKDEFFNLPAEEVAFPRSVNGIDKYSSSVSIYTKGTPFHVRGALLHNHILKEKKLEKKYNPIKEGEKIKYLYLKMPNPIKENVISFINQIPKELNLHDYVDYETQFNKSFLEPLRTMCNCVGWQIEQVATLDDFFA